MKKMRKLLIAALAVLLTLGMSASVFAAAKKKGLVKEGEKYYYYKAGKKVKNVWKNLKDGDGKYRFYFGKNGAAYKADKSFDGAYNVKVYKIKGKKYGFDQYSHRVAGGTYADKKGQIWIFSNKGILDEERTNQLRARFKVGEIRTTLYDEVIAYFGEPLSKAEENSCGGWTAYEPDQNPYVDVLLTYDHYQVQLIYSKDTKEYQFNGYVSVKL